MQHSQGSFVWVLDKLGSFTDLKTGTSCSGSQCYQERLIWNAVVTSILEYVGRVLARKVGDTPKSWWFELQARTIRFHPKKWLVWVGFTKNLSSGNNTRVRTNPESTAIVISYMIRMMWDSVTWSWDKTKIYGCIMLYNPEGYRWYNANMFYRYMIV